MKRVLAPLVVAATVLTAFVADEVGAEFAAGEITVSANSGGLLSADRLTAPTPDPDLAPQLLDVLELVNAERARHGLAPMTHDDRLGTAAQLHSEEQARFQQMSHSGQDGSNPGERISRTGYQFWSWAENVAFGYGSAESVMNAWMNSPGHRTNILSSNTEIGLGLAYASNGAPYWTQVFATPR